MYRYSTFAIRYVLEEKKIYPFLDSNELDESDATVYTLVDNN